MSIASKEAEDIYPVTNDELSVESIIMDNDDAILQKAYIAGRTAEPTDVEIEAAASEIESASDKHDPIYDRYGRYVSCSCGSPVSCMEEFDMHWDREMAKAALLAARRAVGK